MTTKDKIARRKQPATAVLPEFETDAIVEQDRADQQRKVFYPSPSVEKQRRQDQKN